MRSRIRSTASRPWRPDPQAAPARLRAGAIRGSSRQAHHRIQGAQGQAGRAAKAIRQHVAEAALEAGMKKLPRPDMTVSSGSASRRSSARPTPRRFPTRSSEREAGDQPNRDQGRDRGGAGRARLRDVERPPNLHGAPVMSVIEKDRLRLYHADVAAEFPIAIHGPKTRCPWRAHVERHRGLPQGWRARPGPPGSPPPAAAVGAGQPGRRGRAPRLLGPRPQRDRQCRVCRRTDPMVAWPTRQTHRIRHR
jgi:hypothetical protein